ncbi:MAG: hypothetical protein ACTSQ8_25880 [Candidatus Helarchaeota archaeon]
MQISEIRALERSISTADLNRLKKMIKLGGLMQRVCQWYDSPEVRDKFESFGLSWSREDIANKVFLISKAQMFKNIKAFELDSENDGYLTAFKGQITRLRNNGVKVSQSLENYIKFVKELTSSETGDISTNQAADTCFMPSESDEITPETIEAEGVANEPPPSSSNDRAFLYEVTLKEHSNDRYFKIMISRDMIIEVERGNGWVASDDQFSQVISNGLRRVEALIEEGTINFVNNG